MNTISALEVENVSYAFGRKTALEDINFQIKRGECTILLGPNGAGKTTLFSLITRLYDCGCGKIAINGHDIQRKSTAALANNHAADYGSPGIRETLKQMRSMGEGTPVQFAGLGLDRSQAVGPRRFTVKSHPIAFSSMGIGNGGLSWNRKGRGPRGGQLNIHQARDYTDVTNGLRHSGADYKILSMHYGTELALRPGPAQIKRWR